MNELRMKRCDLYKLIKDDQTADLLLKCYRNNPIVYHMISLGLEANMPPMDILANIVIKLCDENDRINRALVKHSMESGHTFLQGDNKK